MLLVAEALQQNEELADRVAWVLLEKTCRVSGGDRLRNLARVRDALQDLRGVYSHLHLLSKERVHASIMILLRAALVMHMSSELAREVRISTIDRCLQEIVFVCDFAHVLLQGMGSASSTHIAASYANETYVRALLLLDMAEVHGEFDPSTGEMLSATLSDRLRTLSNPWLRRNIRRMLAGLSKLMNHVTGAGHGTSAETDA